MVIISLFKQAIMLPYVNLSTLTTGLAASTINGVLDVKPDIDTGLFMNGNLDINGALYIANRAEVSGFTLTEGNTNVYEVARILKVATVEETLGNGYNSVVDELTDLAEAIENSRLRGLGQQEMMADVVNEFRINYRTNLTLSDALNYLELNPNRFYHDTIGNKLYIHTSGSSNPSTKTITVIEPINRPTSGTEARCNIKFNAAGVISNTLGGTPILKSYGWYPEREFDQLAVNADLGATTIVLKNGLDLQAGDKIVIGYKTTNTMALEASKGIYTVSAYDSNTKTVTLTIGLQTARVIGNVVGIFSHTNKLTRVSGTTYLITGLYLFKINMSGTCINLALYSGSGVRETKNTRIEGISINHCSIGSGYSPLYYARNGLINNSVICQSITTYTYAICASNDCRVKNSAIISGYLEAQSTNSFIENCFIENSWIPGSGSDMRFIIKNCIIREGFSFEYGAKLINCDIIGDEWIIYMLNTEYMFINCRFHNQTRELFNTTIGKLFNCKFNTEYEVAVRDSNSLTILDTLISENHNQIPGNYKAWCKGGRIETEDSKLKFICESSDYPVFRDYPILVPANRDVKFHIGLIKDTANIVSKLQIIEPQSDPMIDSFMVPLAESTAQNSIVNQDLGIHYKSSTPRQLILRVFCQGMGNVTVDTSGIDNGMAYPVNY